MTSIAENPLTRDRILDNRRSALAFWLGCAIVTVGVVLHVPMFLMGRNIGYRLCGMPMDPGMIIGMGMIVAGIGIAGFGLLPRMTAPACRSAPQADEPADGPLTADHWRLMAVLTAALVIDVMKPASLGFVLPGMRAEYGIDQRAAAWLPFVALSGTVVGSVAWGALADVYGRRAAILLSSVMFIGTSICGTMPSFTWNLAMCALMGAAAGGMLPVAYALLAETVPVRHRGWSLVLVGGLGGLGGYLAASGFSALLQPQYGWRAMWLLNLPTGLILIVLNRFIPESPGFLAFIGPARKVGEIFAPKGQSMPLESIVRMVALSTTAFAWGLINFGLLLWLPVNLAAAGIDIAASSRLLAASTMLACPTIILAALLYWRWSTKWTLGAMIATTMVGLAGIVGVKLIAGSSLGVIAVIAVLIIGVNGILSVLLPYTVESFPLAVRGRAAGWISGCSKLGGLAAQFAGILGIMPGMGATVWVIGGQLAVCLILIGSFGIETRRMQAV